MEEAGKAGGVYCVKMFCVGEFLAVPSKCPVNLLFLLVRVDLEHSATAVVLIDSFVAAFYVLSVYVSCCVRVFTEWACVYCRVVCASSISELVISVVVLLCRLCITMFKVKLKGISRNLCNLCGSFLETERNLIGHFHDELLLGILCGSTIYGMSRRPG